MKNTIEMTDDIIQAVTDKLLENGEVQLVKHGYWIDIWDADDTDTSSWGRCSECKRTAKRPLGAWCRWCGAKMDKERETICCDAVGCKNNDNGFCTKMDEVSE